MTADSTLASHYDDQSRVELDLHDSPHYDGHDIHSVTALSYDSDPDIYSDYEFDTEFESGFDAGSDFGSDHGHSYNSDVESEYDCEWNFLDTIRGSLFNFAVTLVLWIAILCLTFNLFLLELRNTILQVFDQDGDGEIPHRHTWTHRN